MTKTAKQLRDADQYFASFDTFYGENRLVRCVNYAHAMHMVSGRTVYKVFAYFNGDGFYPIAQKGGK